MLGYNQQMNIDRINQQIQDLERLKSGYQAMPQQPIQNIINTNTNNIEFEARYLGENDKPNEILVQRKTAFIDLKKGKLSIKELNGDIKEYEIVLPKDEKDLRIEELERKLREYEYVEPVSKGKQRCDNTKSFEKQPTNEKCL